MIPIVVALFACFSQTAERFVALSYGGTHAVDIIRGIALIILGIQLYCLDGVPSGLHITLFIDPAYGVKCQYCLQLIREIA